MKLLMTLFFLAAANLSGMASASEKLPTPALIEPPEAIQLATAAGPDRGVKGTFLITVQATGNDKARIYLNSELNYRDPKCLTVALEKSAIRWLKKKYGPDLESYFRGKTIEVSGTARRVPIYLGTKPRMTNGKLPTPIYFQTQVLVERSDQIMIRD